MGRFRHVYRPCSDAATIPFSRADEAWFWYARCQRARNEGARFRDLGRKESRPCDPDDIYRYVMSMVRAGDLNREHVRVMALFGLMDRVPDSRTEEEAGPARLWDEAMDGLDGILRDKGIVE
jgi:hypothetical protein